MTADVRLQTKICRQQLLIFLETYQSYDRTRLVTEGYLAPSAPAKGGPLLGPQDRSEKGAQLLHQSKEILSELLFADEHGAPDLRRVGRELLTLTLPRPKAAAFCFLKAGTEIEARGTWRDPENVSNDARAENVLLEVEYGEVADELIGDGIVRCLGLINHLEINEQILYARMINVEQSTLIA